VVINDVREGEEEVALFLVLEAVLFAEAQFLGDARDAEGLAGKSGAQNVVRGNVRHGHGMNVAVRTLAVIGGVGDLRLLIPVGGENALAARALEGVAEAPNAAEEVYEQGRTLTQSAPHPVGRGEGGAAGRGVWGDAVFGRVFIHHCSSRRESALTSLSAGSLSGLTSAATR